MHSGRSKSERESDDPEEKYIPQNYRLKKLIQTIG
jgi:hypothetical protein